MNAVALSPICPLYTAPSAASPLADEVLCGWPLEVCEQPCPGWVRVRTDYRYEGYAPAAGLILGAGPCRRWAEREDNHPVPGLPRGPPGRGAGGGLAGPLSARRPGGVYPE